MTRNKDWCGFQPDPPTPPPPMLVDNRDPKCVEAWPEAESFGHDPRCCRFPKSCSAGGWVPHDDE